MFMASSRLQAGGPKSCVLDGVLGDGGSLRGDGGGFVLYVLWSLRF